MSLGVLLLAAGKGERLKPITDSIPKPLVDIEGIPVILFPIYNLVKSGFREIIVNLHHKREILKEFLNHIGTKNKIKFTFIDEEFLLGTGGTVKEVFSNFKFDKLLIINSDIFINADISSFVKEAENSDSIAHLMITQREQGGVDAFPTRDGKFIISNISGEGKGGRFLFSGIHIVKREIIKYLGLEKYPICIVRDGYIPALKNGEKISASLYRGFFADIGTHERLSELKTAVQKDSEVADIFIKVKKSFVLQ